MGLGAGAAGYAASDIDNPMAQRIARGLVQNVAGPASLLASAGFAGGLAAGAGDEPREVIRKAGLQGMSEFPMPSAEIPQSWWNFAFGEPGERRAPAGAYPSVIRSYLTSREGDRRRRQRRQRERR